MLFTLLRNTIFQFHKGTIRTQQGYDPPGSGDRFQFHKGTIRTGDDEDDKSDK